MLQSLQGEELKQYIRDLLEKRLNHYLKAHIAIEIQTPKVSAAKEIAGYLTKLYGTSVRDV